MGAGPGASTSRHEPVLYVHHGSTWEIVSEKANERNILMGAVAENLGRRLGWQGEDVAAFAETLKAIAEVTAKDVQR